MNDVAPGGAPVSGLRRWLREPLLHFLVIGGLLFGTYRVLHPQVPDAVTSSQIRVTEDDLGQMMRVWTAKWQRAPTPEEISSLVEERVREEVLYREALALGLERDDTIVRRRLAQKMEFLAEDTSAIRDPATAELAAWFGQNRERFALAPRVSFRHLYFSPDRRGDGARSAAAETARKLAGTAMDAPGTARAGDRFMYQDYYSDREAGQVADVFGAAFARALIEAQPGVWQGPFRSGLGWHVVYVESVQAGRVPDLEEILPDVKAEWIAVQRAGAMQRAYAAMRARYDVLVPGAVVGFAAGAAPPDKLP